MASLPTTIMGKKPLEAANVTLKAVYVASVKTTIFTFATASESQNIQQNSQLSQTTL